MCLPIHIINQQRLSMKDGLSCVAELTSHHNADDTLHLPYCRWPRHTHTHTTHDPVEDSDRLRAAPGLYEQNRLCLQLQQIYTVLQPDINNVMLHKDRQTRCILGSTGLCCCRRSSDGGKGGKGGLEDLWTKTGGSLDVKYLWNDCVSTSREKQ